MLLQTGSPPPESTKKTFFADLSSSRIESSLDGNVRRFPQLASSNVCRGRDALLGHNFLAHWISLLDETR